MIYATKTDLATWLGYTNQAGEPDVTQLPTDVDKLLINASRLIDYVTINQIDKTNTAQLEIAKNAATAQCEYWIDGVGESADINPVISSYSAGKFSVQFGSGGSLPKLADRARRELWMGGLLNRRVISL